jgi:xanthine/uracil permease
MAEQPFLYGLDERPPFWRTSIYGLQWALLMFPALVIIASIAAEVLHLSMEERVSFFQKILLLSGGFTFLQTVAGHRYPLQEGPATALLLTFVVLAPQGLAAIQGGFLCGGLVLLAVGFFRWMRRLGGYFTPNVVGVILMLIAFTLVPFLVPRLIGVTPEHPRGEAGAFGAALALILLIAMLANRLGGFLRSTALILGIVIGSIGFWLSGRIDLQPVREAPWLALPGDLWMGMPRFSVPAVVSSALAYLAVAVNSLGSIHGVGGVVGAEGIAGRVDRGLAVTGLAGVAASVLGVVGTVSYSTSPGVILVTRVASRYAQAMCGLVLLVAAFVPRLSALLAAVPPTVVGAALCVALGSQVGAGITAITADGRSLVARDYLVVGLPVMVGTLVAVIPRAFFAQFPVWIGTILGNGLVLGIILVLLLEHLLMRKG